MHYLAFKKMQKHFNHRQTCRSICTRPAFKLTSNSDWQGIGKYRHEIRHVSLCDDAYLLDLFGDLHVVLLPQAFSISQINNMR